MKLPPKKRYAKDHYSKNRKNRYEIAKIYDFLWKNGQKTSKKGKNFLRFFEKALWKSNFSKKRNTWGGVRPPPLYMYDLEVTRWSGTHSKMFFWTISTMRNNFLFGCKVIRANPKKLIFTTQGLEVKNQLFRIISYHFATKKKVVSHNQTSLKNMFGDVPDSNWSPYKPDKV